MLFFFCSSRRRHTRCALVTGVQTCALPIGIDDLGAEGRKATVDFNKAILARLDAIDTAALSRQNQVDALILRNQVEGDIWNVETLQSWAWDPQAYTGLAGGAIYGLMAREFAPDRKSVVSGKGGSVRVELGG